MNSLRQYTTQLIPPQLWSIGSRVFHTLCQVAFVTISNILNFSKSETDKLVIVAPKSEQGQIAEVQHRCTFYVPNLQVEILEIESSREIPPKLMFSSIPLLPLGDPSQLPWISRYRHGY